jgi:hemoglobin/transferrin/lactoferrin receptor protein
VVASKSPRALSEVAAQVTVIDASAIRRNMAEDLNGLLRYEPGLEVESSGTRFGATSINVRGIGGNRVAIGRTATVRDRFVVARFLTAPTRVETDRIKRVEVLYGPLRCCMAQCAGWNRGDHHLGPADSDARAGNHWLGLRGGYQVRMTAG